jgi:hypothetical protein
VRSFHVDVDVRPEFILLLLVGPFVGDDAASAFLAHTEGITFDQTTILDLVNLTELDAKGAEALWTMVRAAQPGVALIAWGAAPAIVGALGDHGLRRHIGLA